MKYFISSIILVSALFACNTYYKQQAEYYYFLYQNASGVDKQNYYKMYIRFSNLAKQSGCK